MYLQWVKLNWVLENNNYYVWNKDENIKGCHEKLFDALYNFVVKDMKLEN